MNEEMTQGQAQEQEPEEVQPSMASRLRALLAEFPSAPSTDEIERWKKKHGDVFVSAFSEDEIFVFRPLSRLEHRKLQETSKSEVEFEENCVQTALLWSSVTNLDQKAGTIPTLLEQVMQNSNFMPPQLAASLVVKL